MDEAVLVPTDGSSTSNRAAGSALGLAARLGARVAFLHVPDTGGSVAAAREEARGYGGALLAFWQRAAERAGVEATTHLVEGGVADAIVGSARALGCDTIVMGTHGRHGAPARMIGSVAERVTRLAPCPVLLLRGDAAPEAWVVHPERLPEELPRWSPGGETVTFRRVLVAVDGRASGWAALARGAALARALEAKLYVLHAMESLLPAASPRTRPADRETLRHAARRSGRRVLDEARERVPGLDLTPLLYEARGHPVAGVVAKAAGDVEADLIVVGTHNRSGLDRWLLGSVASLVTHSTTQPVLLVPLGEHAPARPPGQAVGEAAGSPPSPATG